MRLGGLRFDPPLWAWVVIVPALGLLLWLGTWQVQRGQAKERMLAERAAARQAEPRALPADDPASAYGETVRVRGRYLTDSQLLLDNQVWEDRVGYRVWTPLRLDDGRLVLVDRGWVPMGRDRSNPAQPEAPAGMVTAYGIWRALPEPGLRLAAPDACAQTAWPRVLNYPDHGQVACQFPDATVADGLLLLAEDAAGGFPRDWDDAGLPPMRHYGYAAQWYALALALLALFLVLNTERDNAGKH